MNAEEVVKRLRHYAMYCDGVHACWNDVTLKAAADLIESLQTQLSEAQRRAEAAVEDLRRNRKYKCDCCHYTNKQGQYIPCRDCQSPISNQGDLWQWRGPRE